MRRKKGGRRRGWSGVWGGEAACNYTLAFTNHFQRIGLGWQPPLIAHARPSSSAAPLCFKACGGQRGSLSSAHPLKGLHGGKVGNRQGGATVLSSDNI